MNFQSPLQSLHQSLARWKTGMRAKRADLPTMPVLRYGPFRRSIPIGTVPVHKWDTQQPHQQVSTNRLSNRHLKDSLSRSRTIHFVIRLALHCIAQRHRLPPSAKAIKPQMAKAGMSHQIVPRAASSEYRLSREVFHLLETQLSCFAIAFEAFVRRIIKPLFNQG